MSCAPRFTDLKRMEPSLDCFAFSKHSPSEKCRKPESLLLYDYVGCLCCNNQSEIPVLNYRAEYILEKKIHVALKNDLTCTV